MLDTKFNIDYFEYKPNEKVFKYCQNCGKDLVGTVGDREILVKYNICPRCKKVIN